MRGQKSLSARIRDAMRGAHSLLVPVPISQQISKLQQKQSESQPAWQGLVMCPGNQTALQLEEIKKDQA